MEAEKSNQDKHKELLARYRALQSALSNQNQAKEELKNEKMKRNAIKAELDKVSKQLNDFETSKLDTSETLSELTLLKEELQKEKVKRIKLELDTHDYRKSEEQTSAHYGKSLQTLCEKIDMVKSVLRQCRGQKVGLKKNCSSSK